MIPALASCDFANVELDGNCCIGLLKAKHAAMAILHDCPQVVPLTTQIFGQLSALPDADDLLCRQTGPEELLACTIKALIDAQGAAADQCVLLERYAAMALGHAGRILKHQQGLQDGYQEHATQTTAERERNRQKAERAKVAKGESTAKAITDTFEQVRAETGNSVGINAEVARRVGVTPQRVSQVRGKSKFPR